MYGFPHGCEKTGKRLLLRARRNTCSSVLSIITSRNGKTHRRKPLTQEWPDGSRNIPSFARGIEMPMESNRFIRSFFRVRSIGQSILIRSWAFAEMV
jgi:hypothetical protein